ncbi:MAG: LapA family protein [Bacillota bacterium]
MGRLAVVVLIVLLVALFVGQNVDVVRIKLLTWVIDLPLWTLVVIPLGLGILSVVVVFGMPQWLRTRRLKGEVESLKSKVQQLTEKLEAISKQGGEGSANGRQGAGEHDKGSA